MSIESLPHADKPKHPIGVVAFLLIGGSSDADAAPR